MTIKNGHDDFYTGQGWPDHPPLTFRSMGRFERRLRGLAGSGWNGEHPTGYRWAQRLCGLLDRSLWRV